MNKVTAYQVANRLQALSTSGSDNAAMDTQSHKNNPVNHPGQCLDWATATAAKNFPKEKHAEIFPQYSPYLDVFDSQTHRHTDQTYNEDLFNFTRGRFVCHEEYELAQRHVRFNVEELAHIAAESIDAESCVRVEKYPEGLYNKAMLLTMNDGTQVVARVPNPNAGRKHSTTASEVATMEFVCVLLCLRFLEAF